jgi:hypothetical protein
MRAARAQTFITMFLNYAILSPFPATQRPQKKSQPVATTHKTIRTTIAQVGERSRRLYRTLKSFLCSSSQTRSCTKESSSTTLKSPI